LFNGPLRYTEKYTYISNSMNQITPHTSSCSPRTSSREPIAPYFLVLEKGTRNGRVHHATTSVGRRAAQTGHWHLAVRLAAKETADKRKEDKPEVDFLLFPTAKYSSKFIAWT